jgi:O-antigen/teichoic acid export membrane protein
MRYIKILHQRWRDYRQSAFAKHILIVASGTASAQMIAFLASPVISRLYTPEQFGGLALITTLSALFITVSSLSYESAIVLPRDDKTAAAIFGLSSIVAFVFFLMGAVAVVSAGKVIFSLLEIDNRDAPYFYFVPLIVLTNAIANAMVFWNNRKTLFQLNSVYKICLSIASAVLAIFFGFYFELSNGLIASFLIANIFFSVLFVLVSWKKSSLSKLSPGKNEMKRQAGVYADFPKYYLIQNFFDAFREYFFVLIINLFFSGAVVGAYSFALRIVRVPLTLVSSSISQVAFQRISFLKNNDSSGVYSFVTRLVILLAILSIPLMLVFIFFGSEIFVFVFGQQWGQAGEYTKFIAIWMFASFISSPVSTVPLIFGKTRFSFYYTLIFNVASTSVFYLCARISDNFEFSLLVTAAVSGGYLIFYVIQIIRLVKRETNDHHS